MFFLDYIFVLELCNRGFTKFSRADYLKWKSDNKIVPDGVNAKVSMLVFEYLI